MAGKSARRLLQSGKTLWRKPAKEKNSPKGRHRPHRDSMLARNPRCGTLKRFQSKSLLWPTCSVPIAFAFYSGENCVNNICRNETHGYRLCWDEIHVRIHRQMGFRWKLHPCHPQTRCGLGFDLQDENFDIQILAQIAQSFTKKGTPNLYYPLRFA